MGQFGSCGHLTQLYIPIMYIYITHNVHSNKVITKNWSCNARKEVGLLRLKGLTEHSEVAQYVTVLSEDGMIT